MAAYNKKLGMFELTGLPPAPRGVPQIEVAFDIDANGIVHVTATDKATAKEQKITITGSSGLSKAEVEKMVGDAEAHAADDKAKRDVIEARNQADSLAWSVEKTLNENRDKIPVGDLSKIEAAIASVREAVQGDDAAAITRATDELQRASHAMAEALYKAQQASAEPDSQPGAGTPADGEVVDAEFAETR
jgi:molecular chaperone DnaK